MHMQYVVSNLIHLVMQRRLAALTRGGVCLFHNRMGHAESNQVFVASPRHSL